MRRRATLEALRSRLEALKAVLGLSTLLPAARRCEKGLTAALATKQVLDLAPLRRSLVEADVLAADAAR